MKNRHVLLDELHDASEALALFDAIRSITSDAAQRDWWSISLGEESALNRMVERDMNRIASLADAMAAKYQLRAERLCDEAAARMWQKLPHKAPPKAKRKATAKVA